MRFRLANVFIVWMLGFAHAAPGLQIIDGRPSTERFRQLLLEQPEHGSPNRDLKWQGGRPPIHGGNSPIRRDWAAAPPAPPAPPFTCDTLVYGLLREDCEYMKSIGMRGQGHNYLENNNHIWIGADGPNTFTFVNGAPVPIIIVVWYAAMSDNQASFMNARIASVTYSLPQKGDAVVVSLGNDVPGGWAALYNHQTRLTEFGQIDNTFGEFSTGDYATTDVSRLVNMAGNSMTIRVGGPGGCLADMNTCAYACDKGYNSCGANGTYSLLNCGGVNGVSGNDPHGNPTGGCQGWSNGGHVEVVLS